MRESGQATSTGGVIPAETPKTPDSMGIGQDGTDVCEFFSISRSESHELMTEERQQHIFPRFNSDLAVKLLSL